MPDSLAWLGVGFIVVWAALGGYLWRLWREQRRLSDRLDHLEGSEPTPPRG